MALPLRLLTLPRRGLLITMASLEISSTMRSVSKWWSLQLSTFCVSYSSLVSSGIAVVICRLKCFVDFVNAMLNLSLYIADSGSSQMAASITRQSTQQTVRSLRKLFSPLRRISMLLFKPQRRLKYHGRHCLHTCVLATCTQLRVTCRSTIVCWL
jgi:hypothetical protein